MSPERWSVSLAFSGLTTQQSSAAAKERSHKEGDPHAFWTERIMTTTEEISLTWHDIGEPLMIHHQPGHTGRKYGLSTDLIPALGARLIRNGVLASGKPWPTQREGRPFSTCALAFAESWTEPR